MSEQTNALLFFEVLWNSVLVLNATEVPLALEVNSFSGLHGTSNPFVANQVGS